MEQARVVLSTAPDATVARRLAEALVEAKLAACVNIVPGIRSLYWWEGAVQEDAEVLLICKTDADHLEELTSRLVELHPYDCPEVVALTVAGGADAYLSWITQSLG